MKSVLAFLIVLKSRYGYVRNLKNNNRKNFVRRNAPNIKFSGKIVSDTLPNEERFGVFDCFEVSHWPDSRLENRTTVKNV